MIAKGILLTVLVLVANYLGTTFSIWIGHWFSHLRGSPLRDFHLKALPEIVWFIGRTWVVPKGVPSFVRRGEGR